MQVWTDGNKAIVKCQYEEKELVKAIGDYKFDKTSKTWHFPLSKLPQIIDFLKVEYSPATKKIYDDLAVLQREYHARVNLAKDIKSGMFYMKTREEEFMAKHGLNRLNLESAMMHQLKGVQLGSLFGSYGFFYEPGCGKSYVAIKLLEHWGGPSMVIAPLNTLDNVWLREIQKWSKLKAVNLWHNLKDFDKPYDIYLINYEHFKKLDEEKRKEIEKRIKAMVIDESQKLRSNKSQITKVIHEYSTKIPHRVCLSGTPNPNDLMEYWGQMHFINPDLLGHNFYKFRNMFFTTTGYGNFTYVPQRGAKEQILEIVSRQAFSVKLDDVVDLPEKIVEERAVYLDDELEKYYDQMLKENILEFQGHTSVGVNELAKILKLRQITAGFSITDTGVPVLLSEVKINTLKELLEEIPEERQVIVFCQFHFEIEELMKRIDSAVPYYGVMNNEEKKTALDAWMNKEKRVLIAHPKSGGVGLNLQQAHYIIWFSMSYSQEEFTQANNRIYRSGQKNKCIYFMLLAKRKNAKTKKDRLVDEIIYEAVLNKRDMMETCLEILKG